MASKSNSTGSGVGGGAGGDGAGFGQAPGWTVEQEHEALSHYLLVVCGIAAGVVLTWRIATSAVQLLRQVTSLQNDTQSYFAQPSATMAWFKRHLLYAPLFNKRHNREFQLSKAVNVGTLPTRLQALVLLAYVATNVAFCFVNIPFETSVDACKQLRNRSGSLATVNMIPLLLFAGRNNPLIGALGVSYDTFNLLHRWFGRIVASEAVIHVLAHLYSSAKAKGWSAASMAIFSSQFLMFGFISTAAMVVIVFQSVSVARHAFYEVFKILHIGLAVLAIVGLWYHLHLHELHQIKWLIAVIAIWAYDRIARLGRIVYNNSGSGGRKTLVEALPGNACRVTVTVARPWTFRPGQHAYLYMPTVSLWQSHPFSLAWSDEAESRDEEKLGIGRQSVLAPRRKTFSFIIRARTGMTENLYQRACESPDGRFTTTCLLEGPYGGIHKMHSYGTVVLFAGGVGITHQVPYLRDLVAGFANHTVATRKMVLVWTIQSPEHLEWIRPWMTDILAMEGRREVLRIMLFVSRPRSTKEIHSPSATVQMFPGRPNISTLLAIEMEQQVGTIGVSVCGPGSLSDQVRQIVRQKQHLGAIDFVDEAFSW